MVIFVCWTSCAADFCAVCIANTLQPLDSSANRERQVFAQAHEMQMLPFGCDGNKFHIYDFWLKISTSFSYCIDASNYLWREAGDVWCLPAVCNLRAVIWFHFPVYSVVLLPNSVTPSVLSFFFCLLAHSPELFPEKNKQIFLFCFVASV